MATGAAGDGLLRGVYEGCISGSDMGIQRRPYHKNCKCQLHKSRQNCLHLSKYRSVSYPVRRSWSEGCLALMGVGISSSPCSSPARSIGEITRMQTQLILCKEDEEEETKSIIDTCVLKNVTLIDGGRKVKSL
ncbi:uncharacterized protein LOC111400531 [Olea europaea var. sylvestris]|uniref:uncharacterized protein LOC111400531 n=1 Tax=Olea europaea var. sylvestris TaxID=158386 RepID=UPI000C1CFE9B|nr:uncharacterized protein LOC111400531 [Olea europaea var. sylvestris]